MSTLKTAQRLFGLLGHGEQSTRLGRSGMPDGFFFRNILWFGDSGSQQTAVARGFVVEPAELDALDEEAKADLIDRLRVLLATLGQEYTLQVRFRVESDFAEALERYRQRTEAIKDRWRHRWQVWNRTERYERYRQAMEKGLLRRETLTLFFCRAIDTAPPFSLSEGALQRHFDALARREAAAFEEVQLNALQTIFPDARVRIMGSLEHYLYCYRFLNPSVGASIPPAALECYDESLSIQGNCLFSDVVHPRLPGVSFQLDGFNHVVLAMTSLPKRLTTGMIAWLTSLGFVDFEMSLNLYPQRTERVVKQIEKSANQLSGEVRTNPRKAFSLGEQLQMAKERIAELERGAVNPFNVFLALRLWHRNPEEVISRAGLVRNAFAGMSGAACHHATNPETARQLWYQTWPGWTFGDYRGFDLEADDHAAATLLPWTSSFTGRLEEAEAIYESPRGALVGVSTQVGGVGQNLLILGATRGGKSLLETDYLAQNGHDFEDVLIVEEGLSHGVTARTLGADPIVLMPNGSTTINYLDPNRVILTNEHFSGAVSLCLLMLRETGPHAKPADVSRLEACLSRHLNALYDQVWQDWSGAHPEEAAQIARRAYGIHCHLKGMGGHGNTVLDAWAALRDLEAADASRVAASLDSLDEGSIARFQTAPETRSLVRDVGLSYLRPEEVPTHGQLVEMLTLAPIGDDKAAELAVELGDRLSVWNRRGPYGCLFDGVSTHRLDGRATHFELGLIPQAMEEMRAAAHFLVLNVACQRIVKGRRAARKVVWFEEGARILAIPGGSGTIARYYTQFSKYNCVAATVFQQVSDLEAAEPAARAAILNNSKLFLVSAQPSSQAAEDAAKVLDLSPAAKTAIKRYPMPEHQTGQKFSSFLMVAPDSARKLVGTFCNVVSREVLYAGKSDNDVWDRRQRELANYDDVVEGILKEARQENQNESK